MTQKQGSKCLSFFYLFVYYYEDKIGITHIHPHIFSWLVLAILFHSTYAAIKIRNKLRYLQYSL